MQRNSDIHHSIILIVVNPNLFSTSLVDTRSNGAQTVFSKWWTSSRFLSPDLTGDSSLSLFKKNMTRRLIHQVCLLIVDHPWCVSTNPWIETMGRSSSIWMAGISYEGLGVQTVGWRGLVRHWVYGWRECQLHPGSHLKSIWIIT